VNHCDIKSPYRYRKDCPGVYDASHTCRACQLQKVSDERIERLSHRDLERTCEYASSVR